MKRKYTLSIVLVGLFRLVSPSVAAGPPNDLFANRIALVGTNIVATGTTRGATAEAGESSLGVPAASVWWSWTAPADGTVALEAIGATAPVRLSALQGTTAESLANLGGVPRWLYPESRTSRLTFPVAQGLPYAIVAGIEDAVSGGETDFSFELTWWPRPANDAFAERVVLAGNEITERVHVAGGTAEPWEQNRYDWFYDLAPSSWLSPLTAWWEWQAPVSGTVTLSLVDHEGALGGLAASISSQAAVAVTVLAGSESAQLQLAGRTAAFGPPFIAAVTFVAVAGTTYQLALQGTTFPNDPHTLRIRYGQPPRVMLTQPLHGTEWRVGDTVPLAVHAMSTNRPTNGTYA